MFKMYTKFILFTISIFLKNLILPVGVFLALSNDVSSKSTIEKVMDRLHLLSEMLKDVDCSVPNELKEYCDNEGTDFCVNIVGVSRQIVCPDLEENTTVTKNNDKVKRPKSCKEIKDKGHKKSGVYEIQPKSSSKPFMVYCDMVTRDGGWNVIQNRFDGSECFDRLWRDYKFGFGELTREFWIGLENIHHMTNSGPTELLVQITDRDNKTFFAHYKTFKVGSELEGYKINDLSGYTGNTLVDSLNIHKGCKFSTKDIDQDMTKDHHCARKFTGGWWFHSCLHSNLNGKFINIILPTAYRIQCIFWTGYKEASYCHAASRMLIRQIGK